MAGIYIHIPFCKSRCRYCDFFSTTQLERREDYAHAIIAEFNDRLHLLTEPVRTIYFGGGTPSQMPVASLRMILECLLDGAKRLQFSAQPYTLHSTPYTLHPTLYTILHYTLPPMKSEILSSLWRPIRVISRRRKPALGARWDSTD